MKRKERQHQRRGDETIKYKELLTIRVDIALFVESLYFKKKTRQEYESKTKNKKSELANGFAEHPISLSL